MAIYTYPGSVGGEGVLPAWMEFRIMERNSPRNSTSRHTINLYMPEQVSMPSTVNWGASPMGAVGAAINSYKADQSLTGAALAGAGAAGAQFAASKGHAIGHTIGKMAGMNYSQEKGGAAVSAAIGKTMNPYLTAVFEGVGFRTFNFGFRFSPHSEDDCEKIDNIVTEFRKSALPDSHSGDAVLNYPDEFDISYKFGKDDNKWLRKFKRSVLMDIDVKYGSGDTWSQHRNGFPTMISLSLTFKEIEIVLRKDVEEGF